MAELPLDYAERSSDILSSLLTPTMDVITTPSKFAAWFCSLDGLAAGQVEPDKIFELKISIVGSVAMGERRKENCDIALALFQQCERLSRDDKASDFCRILCKFNTAHCLKHMNRHGEAISLLHVARADTEKLLQIDVHKSVHISGLQNREELNGKVGSVVTLNVSPGRHAVTVDGKTISVKPGNLKVLIGSEVEVADELLGKIHHYLADMYGQQQKFSEEEHFYEKALVYFSTSEKSMSSIVFLESYLNFVTHRFNCAGNLERLYLYHLRTTEEISGKGSSHYSYSLGSCGNYYLKMHDYKKASDFYLQSLECSKEGPQTPTLYINLVVVHKLLGDFDAALTFATSGLKIAKEHLPPGHITITHLKSDCDQLRSPGSRSRMIQTMNRIVDVEKQAMRKRPKLSKNQRILIKSMIMERRCELCKSFAGSLRLCSVCKSVYYCGKEHQIEDWPRHKIECKDLKDM